MASQHETGGTSPACCRVAHELIDKLARRKDADPLSLSGAGVILSHSQPVLCSHVLDLRLTSSPETFSPRYTSLSLAHFIHCALLVLGRLLRSSRRAYTTHRIRLFAPRSI